MRQGKPVSKWRRRARRAAGRAGGLASAGRSGGRAVADGGACRVGGGPASPPGVINHKLNTIS